MSELLPAIPAATLILLRDIPGAAPELLMIERAGSMAFAAGAMVFPGGRVDEGDHLLAADPRLATPLDDGEDAAARVAAIRECIEEVGLAVGFAADAAAVAAIRDGLAAGEPFGALLGARGLALDLAQLVPFARWRPNFKEARLFDTRFYLAAAPEGDAAADGGESVHALWASAQAMLDDAQAERRQLIFPTRRNLERIATFASLDEARTHAAAHPVRLITPFVEHRDGVPYICIAEGLGYPVTSEPLPASRIAELRK